MLLAALCHLSPAQAQAPTWAWARNATVSPSNVLSPARVATDAGGNSYVLGQFGGATSVATFGTLTLSNGGTFLAKLDPAGNYLWAQRLGGTATIEGSGLAVDVAGNITVAGSFSGTMTLGTTTLTASTVSTSIGAFFVGKLSAAGSWLWATSYGSSLGSNTLPSVAATPSGDVLLAGTFSSTYASGPFAFTLGSTTLVTAGGYDAYVARLNGATGAWSWALRAGGSGNDEGLGICADAAGNALVSGSFGGTATFGTSTLVSAGGSDVLVGKLNPAGQWLWASGGGGLANDQARAIAVDRAGNPVVTGNFRDLATFGTAQVGSAQIRVDDVLVAKLSSAGQWQWAARAGGGSYDNGYGVAVDSQDNVYVGGGVSIQADFGSTVLNPGTTTTSSAFVGRLSPAGAWQWAVGAGDGGGTIKVGFALDAAGNAYITSRYQGTAAFGSISLSSGGQFQDAGFVAKLGNTALASRMVTAAALFALAPNPMTPGSSLALHATAAGTFELHDALGRLVLPARPVSAGEQRLALPATLPPGVYLATLRTTAGTATHRLILE